MFKANSVGYDKDYKGLDNSMGANNCFLNVVIQSLWHLASFRKNFQKFKMHKHKKGKTKKRASQMGPPASEQEPYQIYPDPSSTGASAYPSLDPIPGYPSMGGADLSAPVSHHVPTKGSTGYPTLGSTPGMYPDPAAPDNNYGVNSAYVDPSQTAYPSLDGVSHNKFHEEVKAPVRENHTFHASKTKSLAYPSFDNGGNIISDENEPTASTQMPYRSSTFSKPEKEMSLEETCLFCNLLTLFVNYEFDDSNILTPSHVRQALDAITGNNEIQGFAEGSMACAQETFEEILR